MKAVVTRVNSASVSIDGSVCGRIGKGFLILLGVAPEDAAAFGDNFNDVQMLEAVGMPYLMGNAPEALKECFCNHAPDNDHDGIAWALEEMGV